jgi:trimethylamine:corrinoid methyltransferase-like protein
MPHGSPQLDSFGMKAAASAVAAATALIQKKPENLQGAPTYVALARQAGLRET